MSGFVTLENVKKIYHMGEVEIMAAAGIDFEIQKGEFAAVVGPSGAGKTTVLNILGGMDTATEGKVLVDGQDIAQYSQRRLTAYRRDDIGFVFQFYNLIPNLTALENVELALQICKDPMDAREVLEEVGLGERLDNFPAQLSGGEQQRIAIARAVLKNAPILILDEATAFADPDNEVRVQKALSALSEGKTVIMIAHRLSSITNADSIYVMHRGRIVESGTHRELLEKNGIFSHMWKNYSEAAEWKIAKEAKA